MVALVSKGNSLQFAENEARALKADPSNDIAKLVDRRVPGLGTAGIELDTYSTDGTVDAIVLWLRSGYAFELTENDPSATRIPARLDAVERAVDARVG